VFIGVCDYREETIAKGEGG